MKRDLRIVFMGTPEFAVESLRALVENNFNVVGVVTVPDKPAGRGQKLQMSAVKKYALSQNLPVLQPAKLKSKKFLAELEALNHNLQVVVAFRMLPEVVFSMPEYGSFNLHGSLLPQYRGAAPINWAVINGEEESGVTTFFLKKKIDTGNIIFNAKTPILKDDTAGDLHDKLMVLGADLVVKTVRAIEDKTVEAQPQNTEDLTLKDAPKIFREDCLIDFDAPTEKVYNMIRGLSPYPGAYTNFHGKTFKIFESIKELATHDLKPGEYKTDEKTYLKFSTQDGFINCKKIQLEGKKRMAIEDFLRGYKF